MDAMPARFLGWRKANGSLYSTDEWMSTGLPDLKVGTPFLVKDFRYVDPNLPYFVLEYEVYARASEIELIEHKPLVAEDWL